MALSLWQTGVGVKITRAKQHVLDLERRRARAFKRDPYVLVTDDKPDSERWIAYRWQRTRRNPVPRMWGAIAGDAINNVRSALDILWRDATNPKPGHLDHRKRVYFPFKTADELKRAAHGANQSSVKLAYRILYTSGVYKGGANNLESLNAAWVADKHEVPLIVACALETGTLTVTEVTGFGLTTTLTRRPGKVISVEHGKVFLRVQWGRKLEDERQFSFDIAFGEGTPLGGQYAIPTIAQFIGVAEMLASTFYQTGLLK